jgi:ATP-dependent DNA ligase
VVFDANPCIELRSCQAAARLHSSLVINNYYEADGAIVFREACRLGCEGIVSKRLGSSYHSGSTAHWTKVKNPEGARCEAGGRTAGAPLPSCVCTAGTKVLWTRR